MNIPKVHLIGTKNSVTAATAAAGRFRLFSQAAFGIYATVKTFEMADKKQKTDLRAALLRFGLIGRYWCVCR